MEPVFGLWSGDNWYALKSGAVFYTKTYAVAAAQ